MDSDVDTDRNRQFVMALTATFATPASQNVIAEILQVSQSQVELTPRNRTVLENSAKAGNLAQLYSDKQLIGWALIEPLTRNLAEVGLVFIYPEFRSAGSFNVLMKLIASRPERMLLATYDQNLIRYVCQAWEAKRLNLFQVAFISRGRFITKRLNRASLRAIGDKVKKNKPLYAVVGERK